MEKMLPNWTFFVQLILFLFTMAILSRFLFRPMLKVFARRAMVTDAPHAQAAQLKEDTVQARQTVEESLGQTRKEIDRLRAELLGKATGEERDLLAEARDRAGQKSEAMRQELAAKVGRAREQLFTEADDLAEMLANKLLEIQR